MINKTQTVSPNSTSGSNAAESSRPAPTKHSNSFAVFCFIAIGLSFIMLGSSLWLYRTSGAAQLDLSRPGYQPETEEPPEENPEAVPDKTFSGTGSLNTEAIEEFLDLYDKKAKSITNVDAFSLDTLSNESLGITE